MLDLFKNRLRPVAKELFLVMVKVGRGTNAEMPESLVGAYVPAFAAAADHAAAAKAVAARVLSHGFELIDIQRPIKRLDPLQWSTFVHDTWPEFEAHFPNQQAVLANMAKGAVFFGPFAGFELTA